MMVVIFRFSMATGAESSSLSGRISDFLHMPEFLVRKAAHVTEYMVLTLFICLGLRVGFRLNTKKTMIFMGVIAVLYAASDEIHQLFVNARSGKFTDVLIDSIGIVIAIAVYALIMFVRRRKSIDE